MFLQELSEVVLTRILLQELPEVVLTRVVFVEATWPASSSTSSTSLAETPRKATRPPTQSSEMDELMVDIRGSEKKMPVSQNFEIFLNPTMMIEEVKYI